jgi:hypothetical protein
MRLLIPLSACKPIFGLSGKVVQEGRYVTEAAKALTIVGSTIHVGRVYAGFVVSQDERLLSLEIETVHL